MARRPGIRGVLTRMTVVIAVFTLLATGALAAFTARMQEIGERTSAAVESVRIGHEVQIDLMLLEHADDMLVRSDIEAHLRWRLLRAQDYVSSPQEGDLLADAAARVEEYVETVAVNHDSSRDDELRSAAHGSLSAFVDLNVLESRTASELAARSDVLAGWLAVLLAIATIGTGAWLVRWLNTRAIQPLLALADTVERFGSGERSLRFDESGPRELSDIAARFNQMADALAQQRTTQMTHLAGVAHDLRNPVWALQLALQAARETDAGDLARQRRSLDLAERQVGRLGRMIDDLLDASSIEAGHLELRCGLHDIGAIVREIGDQFAGTSKHHRVDCRAPEQPIPAVVDPLRIGQVVTNLVSNAIKYSPEGGAVEIEIRPDGDTVVIEVADHGLGIAANEIAEVFEPFRRLPHGKRRASGMGLGLFVVRRIVEAHGGEITVTSVSGHGSRFRVRLPLVSPQITADDAFITPSENASEQRPAHAGR